MGDCFPKNYGSYSIPDHCQDKTGSSEYAVNYKKWCNPIEIKNFAPLPSFSADSTWKQRYSFSKGPRFGIPPYCDCTPPHQRFRFETTYNHDYTDCIHKSTSTRRNPCVEGVKPQYGTYLPKQFLCPFTTETTYSRAFDMPQAHFGQICCQNEPCPGSCGCNNEAPCCNNGCSNPCGVEIRYSTVKKKPCWNRLKKEDLIPPGTDTSDCCRCPKDCACCCPIGEAFTAVWYPATSTPTERYPNDGNTPKYVPNPRDPKPRPNWLCGGGTAECPTQRQYPTQSAIEDAKCNLMNDLQTERCCCPPECIESLYRASYRVPPSNEGLTYSNDAKERYEGVKEPPVELDENGLPTYCRDGGKPPSGRPPFDHFSTYEADFVWDNVERFKKLGGEIPGNYEVMPLCSSSAPCEVIHERTEEKERWGEDWECCPIPQ